MSFPARRSGALGAQMLDKRVLAHTCDPVSHVPHSVKHKGGCHRWFYTCSCLAFSTLVVSVFVTQHDTVTSTFGSLTARPRFQLTAANTSELLAFLKESIPFPSFMVKIYHRFFFFLWPLVTGRGGVFFFFEHSFNCIRGQNIVATDVLIRGQEVISIFTPVFDFTNEALYEFQTH